MDDRDLRSERLPSVDAAGRQVSAYLEALAETEGAPVDRASALGLGPLDALLAALYLERQPERVTIIDLAAEATRGASSVLCARSANVRGVRIGRGALARAWPSWRLVLEQHVRELGSNRTAPIGPVGGPGGGPRVVLAHLGDIDRATAEQRLDEAQEQSGAGSILVLGLGESGRCAGVAALLARGINGRRATLFRELAGVVGASGLGLLANDDEATAITLERINAFFTGNFDFLRLVEGHCRLAMAVAELDDRTRGELRAADPRAGVDASLLVKRYRDAVDERDRLRAESDRHRDDSERLRGEIDRVLHLVWLREREGDDLRRLLDRAKEDRHQAESRLGELLSSGRYRIAERVARLRQDLAPDGTLRGRSYHTSRAALVGLARRISRKAG
jgi:hypothetical protein